MQQMQQSKYANIFYSGSPAQVMNASCTETIQRGTTEDGAVFMASSNGFGPMVILLLSAPKDRI